jgi:hypothetical protein
MVFLNSLLTFKTIVACNGPSCEVMIRGASVICFTNVLICIEQLVQISIMLLIMTLNGVFQYMMTSTSLSFSPPPD